MDFTLYLVRHGQYDNPENIYPFLLPVTLSQAGREHIGRVAHWFSRNTVHKTQIITSPVVRTVQTAEIIAAALHSIVTVDIRLIETQYSQLQGVTMPEHDPFGTFYEKAKMESYASMQQRMVEIWEEKKSQGRDCILISHGDPLTLLYYHIIQKVLPPTIRNVEDSVQKGEVIVVHYVNHTLHTVKRI